MKKAGPLKHDLPGMGITQVRGRHNLVRYANVS